jgi:hypothetical protein
MSLAKPLGRADGGRSTAYLGGGAGCVGFDIKAAAEEAFKKAQARGERAFIQPPLAAWAGKH